MSESGMTFNEWLFRLEVPEDLAKEANRARAALLESLSAGSVIYCSGGSKIYHGDLSPGCVACARGVTSFCFINRLCTANCFFCPQDRSRRIEKRTGAEGIAFEDPDAYIKYLRQFGFQGVGFSGGEPLLVLDKLLSFIRKIKNSFGRDLHTWIYTNGDLANANSLSALRDAGLDEIRFNLSARGYDLEPVAKAVGLIETVTVEIPAIPEDFGTVQQLLAEMERIGVRYLNLHQLSVTRHSFRNFSERHYTIVPSPDHPPVVLESELAALRLLGQAAEERSALSVNYCSATFKQRYQSLGLRKCAASSAKTDAEMVNAAGYVMRLSVNDAPESIRQIITALEKTGRPDRLWSVAGDGTELTFHPTLLDVVDSERPNLTVRFFLAEVVPGAGDGDSCYQRVQEFHFAAATHIVLRRHLVAGAECVDARFVRALLGGANVGEQENAWRGLDAFVRLEEGLPEVLESRRYLRKLRDRGTPVVPS
jgi:uncharacterized protein